MTSQDELRNRIAHVLCDADEPGEFNYGVMAQAIIDEFELTTETHAATHSKRAMTRIISAWEWDNQ